MAKRKQVRSITISRIMTVIRWYEEREKPDKLTLELRSDCSGSIINDIKQVQATWDSLDELNEIVKEVNDKLVSNQKQKYNEKYYRGR